MIAAALLACVATPIQGAPAAPKWPIASGASVQRWALKPEPVSSDVATPALGEGDVFQKSLVSAPKGRTLELLLLAKPGTILNYGAGHQFIFKSGRLTLVNRSMSPETEMSGPIAYDVAFVQKQKTVTVFCNGSVVTQFAAPTKPTLLEVTSSSQAHLAFAAYPRALTSAELLANSKACETYAESKIPVTKTVTLALKLGATTPVPDPARLKPYRNALIAQEYTIVSLVRGHLKGLKPGTKVRVLRYGVFDGQKTDLQYLKTGNVVSVTVEPLDANPTMQREYQLDELSSDFSAPYYVEVRGNH